MRESSNIDIYMDHVIVFGQRVNRPSWMSRWAWGTFWEKWSRRE